MPAPRSFQKPRCKNGHRGDDIIKLGDDWICRVCLKVSVNGTREKQSLRERILGVVPEEKNISITDVFPNRAARRRAH